jgi:L-asparaginase/beta-aspartyl-peptidase (threonine type)
MARLSAGESALEGALAAAVVLEDDPRYNAGTGSALQLDGETIGMDAAVMDSTGQLGAVAAIQRVRNPILVAREVADTPHWLLAGEGAIAFARKRGHSDYYQVTERARRIHREVLTALQSGTGEAADRWRGFDLEAYWNFPSTWSEVLHRYGSSTIGSVAMDDAGRFAVCNSTGGASPMLFGRVGDSPIIGCGFYAGEEGAIAATGVGEHIVRRMLCKQVYDWLVLGMPLQEALDRGIALFPDSIPVGLIGVTREASGTANNRQMPTATLVE